MKNTVLTKKILLKALEIGASLVIVTDSQGKITFSNSAVQETVLFQNKDIIGKFIWEFMQPDECFGLKKYFNNDGMASQFPRIETSWVSKYGTVRAIDWNVYEISDNDSLINIIFSGVDITEKNRAKDIIRHDLSKLHGALVDTIDVVAATLEKRDPYTAGHQKRVSELSSAIAQYMGLSDDLVEGIKLGSLIHDIGKIYIPGEILNRPGRLNEHEIGLIKTHPTVGHEIIEDVDFPWPIHKMVLQHHERLDGNGYPNQLKSNEISIEAKIISVADVVEAISSHRPYRAALGLPAGLEELKKGRGVQYEGVIVDTCLKIFDENIVHWEK